MPLLHRREIAKSHPNRLILNPFFWIKHQKKVIIVLLAGALTILSLGKYTYSDPNSSLGTLANIFNLCIHAIGIWAIVIFAKSIATLEVEKSIAEEITEGGERGLREGRKHELRKLEENYLPINNAQPTLAMPRLFRHIVKEAMSLNFESSIEVLEPYRDESVDSLFALTNVQKIAARAGILGTFVGLLEAILRLANLQEGQTPMEVVSGLSNALFISFSTSIAGLEVAILISFLLMIIRERQNSYFRAMESSAEVILLLARNADNDDQSRVLGELAKVESIVEELGKRFYENTQEIQRSIAAVLDRIKYQTNEIEVGIQQLRQTKGEFDTFISEISDTQHKFIGEVKGIYKELSLKEFRDDIKDGIIFAGETISGKLDQTEETMHKQTEEINQGIDALLETRVKFTSFLRQIDSSQTEFVQNVKESQDTVAMVETTTELKASINRAIRRMEEITTAMREIDSSLRMPLTKRIIKAWFG